MFGKLQPVDYENKLRDVANERPKGELYPQGKWLVEDPDFINWRATPNSFLWLNGKGTYLHTWSLFNVGEILTRVLGHI